MKKFSEFIDKLTLKQAQKYSLLSAIVFTLLCFITITLILHSLMDPIIILLTLALALLVGVAFWYLSCTLLFDVDLKKAKQRVITKYSLTKDSYTEVSYIQEDFEHASNMKILTVVINNSDCKFYAKLNDILCVYNTGAYNYSMENNYNRTTKNAMVLVNNSQSDIIVNRETLDDLISHEVIPNGLKNK